MTSERPIKSAWVITQEGTRHTREVISVFSARKAPARIKEYLEWLYALLHCYPDTHLAAAKYTKPKTPCEAEFDRTNINVPRAEVIRCGHNPLLVAVLAKDISLIDDDDGLPPRLKWTMPDRIIWNHQTLERKETMAGVTIIAPMNVPFVRPQSEG